MCSPCWWSVQVAPTASLCSTMARLTWLTPPVIATLATPSTLSLFPLLELQLEVGPKRLKQPRLNAFARSERKPVMGCHTTPLSRRTGRAVALSRNSDTCERRMKCSHRRGWSASVQLTTPRRV